MRGRRWRGDEGKMVVEGRKEGREKMRGKKVERREGKMW
jgi:hypothetical protein